MPTRLRSMKKAIGKCVNRVTSGTGRIRYKRLDSEEIPSSCGSGLQTAAGCTRGAIQRIGRACSKQIRSMKRCDPDAAKPTTLRSMKKAIVKCVSRITSDTGRVCYKRLDSEEISSSWGSGLETAADPTRGATHRIEQTCNTRLVSLTVSPSWGSGLEIAADPTRGATHRIEQTCNKRLESLTIPSSWGSGLQIEADESLKIPSAWGTVLRTAADRARHRPGGIFGKRALALAVTGSCEYRSRRISTVEAAT
jgi:hypothetical protein